MFKDELTAWCNRGFDYVGAPWTIKKKYENPIYKPVLAIKSFIYKLKVKPSRYAWLGNKVGNGGLSLRKVDTHLKAVQNRVALIEDFLKKRNNIQNLTKMCFSPHRWMNFYFHHLQKLCNFRSIYTRNVVLRLIMNSCHLAATVGIKAIVWTFGLNIYSAIIDVMIIGFDAKRAFHNRRGLGNYSRDVIRLLSTYFSRISMCYLILRKRIRLILWFLQSLVKKFFQQILWGNFCRRFKVVVVC